MTTTCGCGETITSEAHAQRHAKECGLQGYPRRWAEKRACARCGKQRPHKARGLCNACYTTLSQRAAAGRDDERLDYARYYRTAAEIGDEGRFLISQGVTLSDAARQLRVEPAVLRRAMGAA